jgi:cytochrome c oxidase subunit 2
MKGRRLVSVVGPACAAAILAGCGSDLGLPTPVTEQGQDSRNLWRIFVYIAVAIGLIVYGLVIFAVFRYRRRRHDDGAAPDQRQYHIPLEIFYTAIPIIIVGIIYGLSVRTEGSITSLSDKPAVTVRVVGFQWQWQFAYVGTDVTITGGPDAPPQLVIPAEETVRFQLVAADVIHSFWVPHFIEKRDLVPRIDNQIEVRTTTTGEWGGFCSEFCGLDHTDMTFSVKAVPPAEFDAWLAAGGKS